MAGWLRKLFGSGDQEPILVEFQGHTRAEPYWEPESARLLKQVTKLKKAGKLEDAIETLREAYQQIDREGGGHTIQTYLRLPMLLQKAGRPDEAWAEYNRLIVSDPTGFGPSKELTPMYHSEIYGKMRLFLQREGRIVQAVGFGVMSSVCWATGLYYQDRLPELKKMLENENLEETTKSLLRRAKRPDAVQVIKQLLRSALENVPNVDMQALVKDVHQLLADHPDETADA